MPDRNHPPALRGDILPRFTVDRIDPYALKIIAALMDDPNPIHFDADAVREAGLGDRVIAQGPMTFGYLLAMIGTALGSNDGIRSARIRFLDNLFVGDTLECSGVVNDITADGTTATLNCRAEANGRAIATMQAIVTAETLATVGPSNSPSHTQSGV